MERAKTHNSGIVMADTCSEGPKKTMVPVAWKVFERQDKRSYQIQAQFDKDADESLPFAGDYFQFIRLPETQVDISLNHALFLPQVSLSERSSLCLNITPLQSF